MTPYGLMRASPYSHPHNVARSLSLAAVKQGVKRDAKGDTVLAQINPHEAAMLIAAGGSGRRDPRTGIIHFDPTGGSNAGGAGHAGDSGNMGGKGGGGGNANSGGTGRIGGGGGFGPGHSGGGISGGDTRADPGMPGGGTSNPSFGGSGAVGASYAGHAYNPGMNINLGRTLDGLALGLIPGAGIALSAANSLFGPSWGPSLNIGSGWSPGSGSATSTADGNGMFGPAGMGRSPTNIGQNGGGQGFQGGLGSVAGAPGSPAGPVGTPGGAGQPGAPGAIGGPGAALGGVMAGLPSQQSLPLQQNPYMPWRQFMSYQNPANLGALPFTTPYG